ncbi:Transport and Golgi organization 2 [Grifola frondosa]|uniref:Transport and Golgi organization 2 n=1 Tax=Grifola frondosa TaxID=5627 RepID=A0A1C7LV25_GRIFR|nr:Transport and Golgi organization 2 [Grifola frondosa]
MCVGFWSLTHPKYALILCNNRDEYLSRPTAPAHLHSFGNNCAQDSGDGSILSGRDLLAGGTWAGISRTGRVALLTNITEPLRKYSSSRGSLTSTFLLPKLPSATLQDEIDEIVSQNVKYAGFNMLLLTPPPCTADVGERERPLSLDAAFVTNSGGGGTITARMLSDEERRCGGMSNGVDHHGASEWPKVKHGIQALNEVLNSLPQDISDSDLAERLFTLLTWKSDSAPLGRAELRNTIQVEPMLIPMIESPDAASSTYYGTRLSTVILIRKNGNVLYIERDIWMLDSTGRVTKGDTNHDRVFHFQIEKSVTVDEDARTTA